MICHVSSACDTPDTVQLECDCWVDFLMFNTKMTGEYLRGVVYIVSMREQMKRVHHTIQET